MFLKRSLFYTLKKSCSTASSSNKLVLRAFASSALKKTSPAPSKSVASGLLKELKQEYEAQTSLTEEMADEMNPSRVIENYQEFLSDNKWTIEHAENSTLVTLKRRDDGLQADVAIKFDLVEVFNELNREDEMMDELDSSEMAEMENDRNNSDAIKSEYENSEEIEEEVQFSALPFILEIKRDSITDKSLLFDCVLEGDEMESEIIIENVSIMPVDPAKTQTSYLSPTYSHLSEELQENFEEFVKKLVSSDDLMSFIKDYSLSNENLMYQGWLKDVTSILQKQ